MQIDAETVLKEISPTWFDEVKEEDTQNMNHG